MSVNISNVMSLSNNLSQFDQTNRLNMVMNLYNHAAKSKQNHHSRWVKSRDYYLSISRELQEKANHESKVFVPRPFIVIETKLPRMVQPIFTRDPVFSVNPVSDDDVEKAKMTEELLTHQIQNQPNGILEYTTWMKDCLLYGTSIGKTGWEFMQQQVTRRVKHDIWLPDLQQFVPVDATETKLETTIDRPFFKNVDISEIFPDPQASCIEDCKYIIHKYQMSRHSLKQLEQIGVVYNIDNIRGDGGTSSSADANGLDFSTRSIGFGMQFNSPYQNIYSDPVYDTIEIMECWWIDPSNNNQRMKTIVANNQVIIQDIPIPYWHNRWPFIQLKNNPMTREFWGIGEIEPIVDMVDELNSLRNDTNDLRRQYLKAFWVVNRSSRVDIDELENMPPGGILEVTGNVNEALQILRPPNMDLVTLQAQQQLDADIQLTTGANDIALGQSTGSQIRSATLGSLLAQSTASRFNFSVLLHVDQVKKIGQDFVDLNKQFLTTAKAIRILGADGLGYHTINITPSDIPDNYDLYVNLGAEADGNADVKKQQGIQLLQLGANIPGFRITEFYKQILELFQYKNPDRFFEGSQVVPTWEILKGTGISQPGQDINSNFAETLGGLMGGGLQQTQAAEANVLEVAQNPLTGIGL